MSAADRTNESIPVETEVSVASTGAGADRRPRMPEPLPVRLVAVEDVRLPAPRGVDEQLDALYAGILRFERVAGELSYRSENFVLRFELTDRPAVHASLRPQGIEVLRLADVEHMLIEAEIEHTRQRGLMPGQETLLLLDPAGNWIEIGEIRLVG
jgi:hypothetical protein